MKKITLMTGITGALGIACGAFGAHELEATLAARGTTKAWDTAVLYHLIHVVALWVVASRANPHRQWRRAGWCWFTGILLFSGSLYWLALGGPRLLGPVTPLGGIAFITGWGFVAASAWTKETKP